MVAHVLDLHGQADGLPVHDVAGTITRDASL